MAIFDKAKEKFQGFMQGGEQANRNRRSNGGTSGYRPVRNQNTPQPQQEVPAGAFGGGVMPDTMFGGNAGFESVAATGRQNPSGAAPQQTAKHRSFQDLLNRALGKQDKQSGAQPVQPPQLLYFPAFLRRIIILTAATIAPAIRIRSTIEAKFIFSPLLCQAVTFIMIIYRHIMNIIIEKKEKFLLYYFTIY